MQKTYLGASSAPLLLPRSHVYIQEQLRDEDLTALDIPVLFVRGLKDPFSTNGPWTEVLSRMSSDSVEVESVDRGDHSLSTKTKHGRERCA